MNQGFCYTDQIDRQAAGASVLAFYVARYTHSTEAEWLERIRSGAVRLDGEIVALEHSTRCRPDD